MFRIAILSILILFGSMTLYSQTVTVGEQVVVTTLSGDVVKGELISQTSGIIKIKNVSLGVVSIIVSDVKSLKPIYAKTQLDTVLKDINGIPIDLYHSNRYYISPSGYSIPKGKSYYENIGVFFNSFAFGVSDDFSLAVGFETISLLYASRIPLIYISPRFHVSSNDKGAWSLGATFISSPEEEFEGIGVLQTAFTIGSRNSNFTIGAGIGFSTYGGFDDTIIPLNFSAVSRISKKVAFVTDNFIVMNDYDSTASVLSAGIRIYVSEKGAAFNLSLWRPLESIDDFIAFPFVSFSLPMK